MTKIAFIWYLLKALMDLFYWIHVILKEVQVIHLQKVVYVQILKTHTHITVVIPVWQAWANIHNHNQTQKCQKKRYFGNRFIWF